MCSPVALPNGDVSTAAPLPEKLGRMTLKPEAPPSSGGGADQIDWHDPSEDALEDDWTDDEALGYLQISVSEDTLLRGFAAAANR